MNKIAIVITGYNRAHALAKLFESLNSIKVNYSVPLIISIDNYGTEDVNNICEEYNWPFGPKKVIIHQRKLGLKNHFIWAGDRTQEYDNVLFLEDDLYVSPEILNYAQNAIDFYQDDERIAGISCYNPLYTLSHLRFYQTQDGYDNYFLQHPYWGNVWSKNKWIKFKEYLDVYKEDTALLPISAKQWKRSFKKVFMQYLIETHRTIVLPRMSFVSNNGIGGGDHNKDNDLHYHVPLCNVLQRGLIFSTLENSNSIYDAFEEISPNIIKKFNPTLREYDFEVDLNCNKSSYSKPFVITTRIVSESLLSFSNQMKPIENSLLLNNRTDGGISLAKKEHVLLQATQQILLNDINKNNLVTNPVILFKYLMKNVYNSLKSRLK